jgi:hypothetical protein
MFRIAIHSKPLKKLMKKTNVNLQFCQRLNKNELKVDKPPFAPQFITNDLSKNMYKNVVK